MNTYQPLVDLSLDEVITHTFVNDVLMPSGNRIALVTLDNGRDHTRPNTLGPHGLREFSERLDALRARASDGEIQAIAVTGKHFILAAGADLSNVDHVKDRETAKLLSELGHEALGKLHDAGVPTFVFINGLALGGGLEIALHADYRTLSSGAAAVALPEVFLGLVPGWGGSTLLPNLIGVEAALKVIIENPLKMNRMLKPEQVMSLGIADARFEPASFLEDSLDWADQVVSGQITVDRPHKPGRLEKLGKWPMATKIARNELAKKIGTVPQSPYRALELISNANRSHRAEGFAAEDDVLADLIAGDQFAASIYAFNLVQKRAKKPAGAPDSSLAMPVTKVGIIGGGLMARQFALLFLRRLRVPVVITDLSQERVEEALLAVHSEISALHEKKRISTDESHRLHALISGTTEYAEFHDADWIIEAVFEDLEVKRQVFASVEPHVSPTAVFATNTSSLSVTEIGHLLEHPERVIGFHFFNPVSMMPLIEVVRAQRSTDATVATALNVARQLRKNAVVTADEPGFVVNRLLAKVLGEAMYALDNGTPFETVNSALDPFGLPMSPFELLELVGLKVGAHVLDAHHLAFPDRFYRSDNLHLLAEHGRILRRDGKGRVLGMDQEAQKLLTVGNSPLTDTEILTRVQNQLAEEISIMIADCVVEAAEDIDLCMILGAGWPFHMGGITPYLDRVGASVRVAGATFHSPTISGVGHSEE